MNFQEHFNSVLRHLYINPLEKCNLRCKICYTKKTKEILTEKQILDFVEKYNKEVKLEVITICGGEVFTLPYFCNLVNALTNKGIYIQIITNGTIDRLNELNKPNFINLIVSVDGLEVYHDKNREVGNFKKSINFLQKAKKLGFHTEIFSIVTKQNFNEIEEFEKKISNLLGPIEITYHPRKPLEYLANHPISNISGVVEGFDFLSNEEIVKLMKFKKVFPPPELGCYQISLMSDGKIYGCCEGFLPIGTIDDDVPQLFNQLKQNIKGPCMGCSQAQFMCGLKKLYE